MPNTLFVRDFSAGWIPSDDAVNGRPNGQLQMNNLELDRNGALTLTGGTSKKWAGFTAQAHTLYSNYLGGTRYDYSACTDGTVWRNNTQICNTGDTSNAAFDVAFNFTLVCSGNCRLKDNGTTAVPLGVGAPTVAPAVVSASAANAPWALIAPASALLPANVGAPGS